ncbi:hypothetical protein MP387_03555 [Streptococcus oralis]|uniref:hypothetical protein n=1 Tax=Streptococcus oralis TaxID=1303 RepID=UPI001F6182CA|nr:hypothetical protein [Streptococcus oralis]UNV68170.1 hypothetical protein MP387_03555 [Streptococcus oralis]
MDKFKNIFVALNKGWLIRHYLFSLGALAIFAFALKNDPSFYPTGFIFFLVSSFFYPFAMFVYESIVELIMGDNILFLPALVLVIWKIVRFFVIWTFSIPIGIIGLIYLYFKVNRGNY